LDVGAQSIYAELYKNYFRINLKENTLKNFTQTPTYRNGLDLVITAPDGTIACFCTIRYDEKNKIGTFEPVACHPDHKRKGLCKAIMLEGLKRARDLGANIVTVQTSDPRRNLPANKLYESVGFRKAGDLYFWRKKVL
jgi:predicted N-acetyltransferase YhbS